MPLTRVTITGVDDATDLASIAELTREFPFVEWGILYSDKRRGELRYPLAPWGIALAMGPRLRVAVHLCGSAARAMLEGVSVLAGLGGERVQINAEFPRHTTIRAFSCLVSRSRERDFILQVRDASLIDTYAWVAAACGGGIGNVSLLFDASGGRGIAPPAWPAPPLGLHVGYAGGITPENVVAVAREVNRITGDEPTWIDMESGVRNSADQLDLAKVRRVLEQCAPLVVREAAR